MRVLSCSRYNCENIMCDRYSKVYGYICYECFDELVLRGVKTDISEFMCSNKQPVNKEATNSYFGYIFPFYK